MVEDGVNVCALVHDELVFMVVADEHLGRNVPFAFLKAIESQFYAQFGQRGKATNVPFAMSADFGPILQRQMAYYSTQRVGSAKMSAVQSELDSVTGTMRQSIEKVLERGEKIESLEIQSESLMSSSSAFRSNATQLHRVHWWQQQKQKLAVVAVVCLVLFIIASSACGGLAFPDCA